MQNEPTVSTPSLTEIVTPAELIKLFPTKFTKPQLSWLLRNRKANGLQKAGAVALVGRRYYINQPKFTTWLLSQK